jgi:hypothetical protein
MVSVAKIRGSSQIYATFQGIICADVSEFESSHPSHAVWSLWAIPPGANIIAAFRHFGVVPVPVIPKTEPLFDYLVRDQVCGGRQPKLPRRVRIDDQLKFRGLHDRQIGGFGTRIGLRMIISPHS